jgi:hypothetical protein
MTNGHNLAMTHHPNLKMASSNMMINHRNLAKTQDKMTMGMIPTSKLIVCCSQKTVKKALRRKHHFNNMKKY